MEEKKIAILLSTYNGALYLEDQMKSIIAQDYPNWELYIRDDGSQDSTVQIIKKYSSEYKNIHFLPQDHINKGAALSFMYMLHLVNADYYMFCDQDDIWHINKISTVLNIINKNELQPALAFSDAEVVDRTLQRICTSFWEHSKTPPLPLLNNPSFIAVYNCAPGCTMIFNHALKCHLEDYDNEILMHDWYVMIKALQNATVTYSKESLMLYRQHPNNVLGAEDISFASRFYKLIDFKKSFKAQMELYTFVRKYISINLFKFYILKLKFNYFRFQKF